MQLSAFGASPNVETLLKQVFRQSEQSATKVELASNSKRLELDAQTLFDKSYLYD